MCNFPTCALYVYLEIPCIGFLWLWVKPDLIAVPEEAGVLKEAPAYIAAQAKAFVGVVLAHWRAWVQIP